MKLSSIPQLARNANRWGEILTILSKYGLADWATRLHIPFARTLFKSSEGPALGDLNWETRVRLVLSDLGTTFIKLGQVLSTRSDIVGPALALELTKLQTAAPADPPDVVRETIERELKRPIAELFAEFEEKPIASASIGQVHRARLHDGQWVVLKVQHANIVLRIRTDLDILVGLAELAEEYIPELKRYRPRAVAQEFQRMLLRELDFHREQRNLQQFAANFTGDDTVRFPTPFPELTTARVLTMEMLEGTKLAETDRLRRAGVDLEDIARRGGQLYLDMVFRDGFYHADPHPGNLLILEDGAIGMLDCGMVGRLDEHMREQIEMMLMAIAQRDPVQLTSIITRIGSVPPRLDRAGLNADITDFLFYYSAQPLDQLDLGAALTEMMEIVRRYQIVLPAPIAMLIKVLVMLEGTSRLLNPTFSLGQIIQSYRRKLMLRHLNPMRRLRRFQRFLNEVMYLGEVVPRGLLDIVEQIQSGSFDIHLEHRNLEPSVNRLVFGMITSALFLGSSWLWSNQVPPLLFGIPVFGAAGCMLSLFLGLRLLWAIKKSGHLDRPKVEE
ncbi:MAG: ABC1 kinase family protein [Gemmataceae bacterium]